MKNITFVSNIITKPFESYLSGYNVDHCDLNTIIQVLGSEVRTDILVVLIDYSFFFDNFIKDDIYEKISMLKQHLLGFRKKNNARLILSNVYSPFYDFNSTLNIVNYNELLKLNHEIDKIACGVSDTAILNVFNIGINIGAERMYNLQNKFLFQSPFTKVATGLIAKEILSKIYLFQNPRKKVLAVDADNVLWGGIVGEDGIDNIKIDENYPGIIFKYFQSLLKALKNSGILLVIISKNNHNDVKEVFDSKNMPLKWDDFIIKKINWQPKSKSIIDVANELNLNIDSFVFIDDSPFEINEVRETLGSVECYKLDANNPIKNLSILNNIVGLKSLIVVEEDARKTELYVEERKRKELIPDASSVDDYIKNLEINISYSINNKAHLPRIAQLVNKTNQFNLTTRRYNVVELERMMDNYSVFSFQVTDKYGDLGIVGVGIVIDDLVDTLLLSCRALSRRVEEKILKVIQLETGNKNLKAVYEETAANSQVEEFYEDMGFEIINGNKHKKEYILKHKVEDIEFIKAHRR